MNERATFPLQSPPLAAGIIRVVRRRKQLSEDDALAKRLVEHGRSVDVGDIPDFSRSVAAALGCARQSRRAKRLLPLGVAGVLAATAAVAAVPSARTSILAALGLRTVRVERITTLPPTRARTLIGLGRPVSFQLAQRAVPFRVAVPGGEQPDHVFVGEESGVDAVPGGIVTLVYGTLRRPQLLVQEFLGGSPGLQVRKGLLPVTRLDRVAIDGRPGLWLGGAHALSFIDAVGTTRGTQTRLAGRALVWVLGDVTIRIEGSFGERSAVRLARTFH